MMAGARKGIGGGLYFLSAGVMYVHLRIHHYIIFHFCKWCLEEGPAVPCPICEGEGNAIN